MRISCGIDTIRISRIENVLSRKESRFLERVYTPAERVFCEKKGKGRIPSLAARFAAKEAVSKALGTGIGREGVRFSEIEIVGDGDGGPSVALHGSAGAYFRKIGGREARISMSHDGDQAVAVCVMHFENNENEHTRTANETSMD